MSSKEELKTNDIAKFGNDELHVSSEERLIRAKVLDQRLDDSLIESCEIMAEIIDRKLYKELGYNTVKEYFHEKGLTIAEVYRKAIIGRNVAPHLHESKYGKEISSLPKSKLEILARKAEDQIESLSKTGEIKFGDEVWTIEEIVNSPAIVIEDSIKKMAKKISDYEVIVEQKKNAELERDHLKKEKKEMEERDAKYREYSDTVDQIEEDLKEAHRHLEQLQKCLTRINPEALPEHKEFSTVALIDALHTSHENFAMKFADIMFKHNDI